MKEEVINYYNRLRSVFEAVKPLAIHSSTIQINTTKEWCNEFINFWKDVGGVDKQTSYNVRDLGDVVIIEQGKLTIMFKISTL